jgi:hypothetical protein
MTITLPTLQSALTQSVTANNFIAIQSSQLGVTNSSASVTFTAVPGTLRVTMKITNTGAKGCYVASGHTTATAVASQNATPLPASGTPIVSNCDYVAAGSILTQDYIAGTNTIAAITAGSDTTTLEISIGLGQ